MFSFFNKKKPEVTRSRSNSTVSESQESSMHGNAVNINDYINDTLDNPTTACNNFFGLFL